MAIPNRLRIALVSLGLIGFLAVAAARGVEAAQPCVASYVVLGQLGGISGPTPTDWFNIFGEHFDSSVPARIRFGVPVIPLSIERPQESLPPVTEFTVPSESMSAGFKWTFRTRDPGVQSIRVRIVGKACTATTLVDLSPPDTSTAEPTPVPTGPPSAEVLLAAASVSGLAFRAILRRKTRPRSET